MAAPAPSFYGLNPRWFSYDRFYKVYVTPSALCGAWVAGQVYDEETAAMMLHALQLLSIFFSGVMDRKLQLRARLELEYDALDPANPAFLEKDPRNFRLEKVLIESMTLDAGRSLWTAGAKNSGALRVRMRDGEAWKFVLPGTVDHEALKVLLRGIGPVEPG